MQTQWVMDAWGHSLVNRMKVMERRFRPAKILNQKDRQLSTGLFDLM